MPAKNYLEVLHDSKFQTKVVMLAFTQYSHLEISICRTGVMSLRDMYLVLHQSLMPCYLIVIADSANMKWICQGDPNDHHSVIQCALDKIPELAPNQVGAENGV